MENNIQNKLQELEKTAKNYWNISREVAKLLYILVITQKSKHILELGTSNGYSGIWLGLAAKQTGAKILTIEYFQERIDLANENFKYCNLNNIIEVKQGKILDILKNLNNKYDFVFIDANKSEYIDYFKNIEPLLVNNSIVIADNIISHPEEVKSYVNYVTNHPEFETVLLPIDNGIMISLKKT